jgi:hypothetical protein
MTEAGTVLEFFNAQEFSYIFAGKSTHMSLENATKTSSRSVL